MGDGPNPPPGSHESHAPGVVVLHELARGAGRPREPDRFTREELAGVLEAFRIGPARSARPLRRGDPRAPKAIIEADDGRYVLKRRAPGRDDPERVALSHRLMIELRARGLPIPALVGTRRDNNSMLQTGRHVYELTTLIEGEAFDGSPDACRSAGAALARMHRELSASEPAPEVPASSYHDSAHVRAHLRGAGERIGAAAIDPLAAHYERARARVDDATLSALPRRLVHNDWHPGNLLFRDGEVAGIVDLEAIARAPGVLDVATGLVQFGLRARDASEGGAWGLDLDPQRVIAFWRGCAGAAPAGGAGTRAGAPWPERLLAALPALMAESLIAEVAAALTEHGRLGPVEGDRAARGIARLLDWLEHSADGLLRFDPPTDPTP